MNDNGWVVTLPDGKREDPFTQSIKAGVVFAKGMQKDPLLNPDPEPEEEATEVVNRDPRTHVFVRFKDVLEFLRFKIDEE